MELCNQMKKYRTEAGLSQDALAEKIFVSRQTISNWETGKNYPDINSLLRMSEVFGVSVDALLKGDVEEIKEMINKEDQREFD
ncbi:MAG: helix-turn-helix domain-containing protein, partial [Acetatifactor sp.]|nr:helix-turn-helix domain-containing protein [Acetatifactor sp.]